MLNKEKMDEIKNIMEEIQHQENDRIRPYPPKYTKQQLINKINEIPTEIFKNSKEIKELFIIPEKYINDYYVNCQRKKTTLKNKYHRRLLTISEDQIEAFLDNYEKDLKRINIEFLKNNPYHKME